MTNTHRTFAGLLIVLGVVSISAPAAFAHRGRVFGPSFGAPGSGAGQLSFLSSQTGPSAIRTNLAVNDMTHDVYAADPGNHRVDQFEANGRFVRAWGWGVRDGAAEFQVCTTQTTCRGGLSGVAPGEFVTPAFVVIDNSSGSSSGDVYVGDAAGETVSKFTQAGQIVESWGAKGQMSAATGAGTGTLTNGSNMIESVTTTTGAFSVEQEISGTGIPAGTRISSISGGTIEISPAASASGSVSLTAERVIGRIEGAAVDLSGGLWISALSPGAGGGRVYKFDSAGMYKGVFSGNSGEYSPQGLAINSSDELYYVENATKVNKLSANDEQLGMVTPIEGVGVQPITGIAVNSITDELYVDIDEGREIEILPASCVPTTKAFGPFCVPSATFSAPGLVGGAGLAIDTSSGLASSEAVYITETAADKIESIVPEPPAAPLVEADSQTVSDVSGDSATLEATVNPRSEPGEEPTSYRFQYTTDERFQLEGFASASSVPVPDGQLAPNYEADLVVARLQGLRPGTVYHYRVVAENAISRKEGKPTVGEGDGAGGEVVRTFTTQSAGVFSLPDGRGWELVSPPDKHGALIGGLFDEGMIQASTDGNAITYLASAPMESEPPGNSNGTQVLSTRTTGAWGTRDISTPREVANGYSLQPKEDRFFSPDLSLAVLQPFGDFDPSMSNEASEQTVFLRTDYTGGDREDPCVSSCYRPLVTGAPGFANVPEGTEFGDAATCETLCGPQFVGTSPDGSHIVLKANASLVEGAPAHGLYEWANGQLQLVSILPDTVAVSGALGSPSGAEGGPRGSADENSVVAGAVSADGSRLVWSTGLPGSERLYLRDMAREETAELGGVGARLQTASVDGSRVLFTVGSDLSVLEAPVGGALSAGHVTDITPGGGLREMVLGASKDGSWVYFVANTVLASTPSPRGENAQFGQPNLYLYHAGAVKLVAVLSGKDAPDWGIGASVATRMTTTRVSSDGRWLAFMSERSLTGYDNRDVRSGVADEEVFLYDAAGEGGGGGLVCASCDPTGARPRGFFDENVPKPLVDEQAAWTGQWLAGTVPIWTSALYQSRYLDDAGRLFFNSDDALVPSDTNGTEDVYEYEPSGVGGCTSGSAFFSAVSGGCADLVSSGVAKEESAFLDASENGDDVFFLTSAQLSSVDRDSSPDVYDARVNGGFPASQPPPACEGDACQSPVAAPNDPTPGSLTYEGPGNPGPLLTVSKTAKKKALKCAKGKRRSHGKCTKSKNKLSKAGKIRRVGNSRGGRS